MAITHPIPVPVLRQLLRLDPETGRLYWLPRGPEWFEDGGRNGAARSAKCWNSRYAETRALSVIDRRGYQKVAIFNRKYYVHRVVFALHFGRWPNGDTDHINGDKGDNRPINLREATRTENNMNSGSKGGTSRFRGVSWCSARDTWQAFFTGNDKRTRWIGFFPSEDAAARAYDRAVRNVHGEFARLNFPD